MQFLQHQLQTKSRDADILTKILDSLRNLSDMEAAVLLARLRSGEPRDSLTASLDVPKDVVLKSVRSSQPERSLAHLIDRALK